MLSTYRANLGIEPSDPAASQSLGQRIEPADVLGGRVLSTYRADLGIEPRESNPHPRNRTRGIKMIAKLRSLGSIPGGESNPRGPICCDLGIEPKGIEPADGKYGAKKVIHSRFVRVILAQGPC